MDALWWRDSPVSIGAGICLQTLKRIASGTLTFSFALCGAMIGIISEALGGQATETGMSRGAVTGAFAGVIVALEVLDSCLQGELLSKVAIFRSLLNGKVFREWESHAILQAYRWQPNALETSLREAADIFDTERKKDLTWDIVGKFSSFKISCDKTKDHFREVSCVICLQDFCNGEDARKLPICGHLFHMHCIDGWVLKHSSCPICRQDLWQLDR